MFSMKTSKAIVLALAVVAATADAHSKMSLPKPTWDNGYGTNSPSGTIDGPSALTAPSGMSFSTDPSSNTKAFTAALKSSKYGSLKELAFATQKTESGASKDCGFSKVGAAQPLPDVVQWDELTPSHEGPCEVWCDGTMAFHGDNCAKSYTGTPAKLPYDKSKCSGAKVLMSIWLALHTPTWQVYTNCAAIGSGGASGGSSGATTTTTAPAPASGGNSGGNTGGNSGATTGGTTDEYADAGGNSGASTGGNTGGNSNTGGNTGGNSNTGGNTGGNSNTGGNTGGNNNNNKTNKPAGGMNNNGGSSNNNKNTGSSNNNKNTGNNNKNTGNNNNNKNTGNNNNKTGGNRNSWTFGGK